MSDRVTDAGHLTICYVVSQKKYEQCREVFSPEHDSDALRERNSVFKTCASCPFCKKVDALSEPVGAAKVAAE